ncbi:MAG: hypothetical protein IPL72_08915 [Sulfuritalea sp.]|nr:hypothetical protein [Sulfuritalea sp.]
MTVDDLARRILVRHREAGHLRLELPAEICHAAAGAVMDAALRDVAGVYRVVFQVTERRLAVHFDARLCTAADVARALRAGLASLPAPAAGEVGHAPQAPAADPMVAARQALRETAARVRRALHDVRARLDALRQPTAPAGSLQARLQPMLATALTEKAVINFLNDLVAFYLVKVHWELISQRWLKNPVKHADAWLTVFYLMFLLVRYRKSIATPVVTVKPEEPATP